jgi:pyruvate kinase
MLDSHTSHDAQEPPRVEVATTNEQNQGVFLGLIASLTTLRQAMIGLEPAYAADLAQVQPQHQSSAHNLVHYLAMRSVDLRPMQTQLAWLGLSSLGHAESDVLAT